MSYCRCLVRESLLLPVERFMDAAAISLSAALRARCGKILNPSFILLPVDYPCLPRHRLPLPSEELRISMAATPSNPAKPETNGQPKRTPATINYFIPYFLSLYRSILSLRPRSLAAWLWLNPAFSRASWIMLHSTASSARCSEPSCAFSSSPPPHSSR